MNLIFFYISSVVVVLAFIVIFLFKPLNLADVIIGITAIAYSVIFDSLFGSILILYHYIIPEQSTIYMILSAVFVYSLLDIIYITFLPKTRKLILIYTLFWIIAMLIFEQLSLYTKTIVLTGWRVIPWSVITYILTYTWIYLFFKYLTNKGIDKILILKRKI